MKKLVLAIIMMVLLTGNGLVTKAADESEIPTFLLVITNGNETIVYRDVIVKEVSNSNVWLWYVIGITLLLGVVSVVSFVYIRKRK